MGLQMQCSFVPVHSNLYGPVHPSCPATTMTTPCTVTVQLLVRSRGRFRLFFLNFVCGRSDTGTIFVHFFPLPLHPGLSACFLLGLSYLTHKPVRRIRRYQTLLLRRGNLSISSLFFFLSLVPFSLVYSALLPPSAPYTTPDWPLAIGLDSDHLPQNGFSPPLTILALAGGHVVRRAPCLRLPDCCPSRLKYVLLHLCYRLQGPPPSSGSPPCERCAFLLVRPGRRVQHPLRDS